MFSAETVAFTLDAIAWLWVVFRIPLSDGSEFQDYVEDIGPQFATVMTFVHRSAAIVITIAISLLIPKRILPEQRPDSHAHRLLALIIGVATGTCLACNKNSKFQIDQTSEFFSVFTKYCAVFVFLWFLAHYIVVVHDACCKTHTRTTRMEAKELARRASLLALFLIGCVLFDASLSNEAHYLAVQRILLPLGLWMFVFVIFWLDVIMFAPCRRQAQELRERARVY